MTIKRFERRNFLKKAAQGAAAAAVLAPLAGAQNKEPGKKAVPATHKTAAPATPPKPALTLNVRDFGATGDGQTKDTAAIQQALDRCGVLGGGEVVVPAGNYSTGSLALRGNTILRLEEDANLLGTDKFDDYLVTQVRWEGRWIQGHVGLVYAIDADHIGIVGPGKLTGNPALGGRPNAQNPLRHPCVAEFINCNDVRLEDFSTSMRLMWSIHPTNCEHVSIKNLTVNATGGNGDGVDIDSCKHVLIDGCTFSTGDDCISLKSGRGEEAFSQMHTTEDVVISNCTFTDANFACIGIGSEASGGIGKTRIEHCKFLGARSYAIYIKSRFGRGAFIEDIVGEDFDVSGMKQGFLRIDVLTPGIQDEYPVPGLDGIPAVKNFRFSNIRVTDVPVLVQATGIAPQKPLDGFTLSNITGTCEKGIFLANAKDVKFSNIAVKGYEGALLNLYDVTGTGLAGSAKIEAPKIPELIPAPETPYKLH
ncbi:MAG TPA: glycosyl hydrolase family 28-related protein [Candidatus Acidoferrales bacterium]|nr:glycosyl hydrolase family 28-related protein [Candidatus Acidoferrales bacterium]